MISSIFILKISDKIQRTQYSFYCAIERILGFLGVLCNFYLYNLLADNYINSIDFFYACVLSYGGEKASI